ncbi:MAG: acyl-[acyl-carrier-protein]-phospholipid O-acyltransferase [Halioglobus sp.]|jgi:acyl-[acyl-carrier-protein]-phospholipid O-acyltransferase/long-chain-fatty-acid--[acyl-carrier-protein] ligase
MSQLRNIKGYIPYILVVFLNAFVDLGHKIVIQNTIFKTYDGQDQVILTAVVNGLILLPFILLFSPSGFLADRFSKHKIIRHAALAAVGATLLITYCYYQGWFWGAFALTMALSIQSAIYSPAKYGYIKELVGTNNLASANGMVQAVTVAGILLGTFVFSIMFETFLKGFDQLDPVQIMKTIAPVGWVLVALAVVEWLSALRLPKRREPAPETKFELRPYLQLAYLRRNLQVINSNTAIWLSIIGLATFWSISQVMLAAFPAFAKDTLEITNTVIIQGILACSGVGIVLGSVIAARTSRNYIETGLIPVGALGVAVGIAILPGLSSTVAMGVAFLFVGIMGGMFIVPLNSLIQFHAREAQLGTILAGNNWIQNVAMLTALITTVVFATAGIDSVGIFYVLTIIAVIGTGYTIRKLPHSLARIIATGILQRRYRIEVVGFDNLPESGAALLLGNHISWIDWALVQIACPRPIRFVMLRSIYDTWYLKPFFKVFGVVPISLGQSQDSLKTINELLQTGEMVCLFPEGAISRNGHLGKFHSGYLRAVEGLDDGVIIPFYLRGLWGSTFSRADTGLQEARAPSVRRDLIVAFGKAIPLHTPPEQLKQKIFDLSISAWESYSHELDPLPLAWLKTAKRSPSHIGAVDSSGTQLTNRQMVAACACFAKAMKLKSKNQNVGLVLPASGAAAIATMATMLRGKTVVQLNYTAGQKAVQAAISAADIKQVFTSRQFETKLKARGIELESLLKGPEVAYLEDIREKIPKLSLLLAIIQTMVLPAKWFYRLHGRTSLLDDPAAILFSSGSESSPKGIVLSHRNIISNCKQISDVLNTRTDDAIMACLPPFHSFGLTVTMIMPLVEGIPMVCHPDPTDALGVAKAIAKHKATILLGTATFLGLYSRNSKIHPLMLDSLRLVVAGAEKLSEPVRREFQLKFNKPIYEGYGATETTPVASVNIPDSIDPSDWKVQTGSMLGTVGMPLPGTSFKIVDPQTLTELPLGEDGLILISGSQVMLGYLNDQEKTDEVIVELDGMRWYKSGDKGHLTIEGFLVIVDRFSRFAKIGGEMISLTSVEANVLHALDDDSAIVAAVAIPDTRKGEKIILLSEQKLDIDTVRKSLIAANVSSLLIPTAVYQVPEIPKLGSGKTNYPELNTLARTISGVAVKSTE